MNSNDNGKATSYCLCPICGIQRKKKPGHLVCFPCKEQFTQEGTERLEKGEEVVGIKEWALEKACRLLESLREQFPSKKKEYDALQEQVKNEAYAAVKEMANGKYIDRSVFSNAMRKKSAELFKQKGGNKLHAEFKTMEQWIPLLEELIPSLEHQLAEEVARQQ